MRGKTHLQRVFTLRSVPKVKLNVAVFHLFFKGLSELPYNAVLTIKAHRPIFRPAVAIVLRPSCLRPIHSRGAGFLTAGLGFHFFLNDPFFSDAALARRKMVLTL